MSLALRNLHMRCAGLWLSLCLACFFSSSAHAGDTFRIGLTLGLSGEYAELGDMQLKGYRLWENDVNAKGGILGRKIQLIIHDDKSDPQTAKLLYTQMLEKENMDFVFGPYSSAITEAILPVTEKHHYPLLAAGAAADSIWQKGYKNVFGLFTPASQITTSFLELLAVKNVDSVAIVQADDPFSKNNGNGAEKWAKRLGIRVVLHEEIKKGTGNLDAAAVRARDAGAQAVMICGHLGETLSMRSALKKINWVPKAFYSPVGPGLPFYFEKLGPDAEYIFSSSQWELIGGMNPPGSREFYDHFLKTYNKKPSHFAATAYAAGQILETAANKAQSIDRKKIGEMFSTLDIMTVSGRYGVDRTGLQIKKFTVVTQIQKGKTEVVWPENMRTAEPVFR